MNQRSVRRATRGLDPQIRSRQSVSLGFGGRMCSESEAEFWKASFQSADGQIQAVLTCSPLTAQ